MQNRKQRNLEVKLSLACGPHTDYSKTCEVVPDEEFMLA